MEEDKLDILKMKTYCQVLINEFEKQMYKNHELLNKEWEKDNESKISQKLMKKRNEFMILGTFIAHASISIKKIEEINNKEISDDNKKIILVDDEEETNFIIKTLEDNMK